jgi:Zn-dependent membrane protease YugP
MIFDPLYIAMMIPAFAFSLWASFKTKSTFKKYSKVRTARNITGAQAAKIMLDRAGIQDVKIVAHRGFLSDHYNPMTKTLALSEPVYGMPTVSAVGVACHEAGHAIQHAKGYAPLKLRSAFVPMAGIGSQFGMWIMMFGLMFASTGMVIAGAGLFSLVVFFQLVTLPVEFDASARAKKLAFAHGIVLDQERKGVSKVLNAAALTYVAAAVSSLITLLYFLMRAGLLGGRDD